MTKRGSAKPKNGDGPVETSAGLQRPGDPPPRAGRADRRVNPETQDDLLQSGAADVYSARAKSSRHGKVTADRANQ